MDANCEREPARPLSHLGDLRRLPAALSPFVEECRWVGWRWRYDPQRRRWTKIPHRLDQPDRKARSNDPTSWGRYEAALKLVEEGTVDGLGFMLKDSDIAAFDLDDCRDPQTGSVAEWASDIVAEAGSYTEVTISGTGLRILGTAVGAHVHRKQTIPGTGGSIETYRRATRYIVVTGLPLHGERDRLENIDTLIDETVARLDRDKASQKAVQAPASSGPLSTRDAPFRSS
jgi:primase-polymerase (primpol)-like protein